MRWRYLKVCTVIHGLLKRHLVVPPSISFTASNRPKFPRTHWNISTSSTVVANLTTNPHLLVIPHHRPHAHQDMLSSSSAAEFSSSLSPDFYPVTTKINPTTACGDLEPTYLTESGGDDAFTWKLALPGFPRQEACGIFHLVTDYCTKIRSVANTSWWYLHIVFGKIILTDEHQFGVKKL